MTAPDPMPLVEQVGVLGAAVWTEERLSDLETGWSADEPDAEVAVHLNTFGRHHHWHASRFRDCLPDSPALDAAAHIRPPSPGWQAVVGDQAAPNGTGTRLVVLERVLGRTVAGYEALARRLTPVADGATLRAIDHVLADQRAELAATRALLGARADVDVDAVGGDVDRRLGG